MLLWQHYACFCKRIEITPLPDNEDSPLKSKVWTHDMVVLKVVFI